MSTNIQSRSLQMNKKQANLLAFDKNHVWHPYTSMSDPLPSYLVKRAEGVHIELASGEKLVDGMSSWWSVLHGYNHPRLNQAMTDQLKDMSHVMFGGLTHEPAVTLAKKLIDVTPDGLDRVFFSDSGSVAVEVAIKMSLQFWQSQNKPEKHKLLTVRNGYHGDTFAAMSVCDPVTGMHQIFDSVLMKNIFAPKPASVLDGEWLEEDETVLTDYFRQYHQETAAFIIEPIVQGTGGMRFYHPNYLKLIRKLCDQYDVLFIADEIATGLGRTGKLFGCNWADVTPDIMCLGKTLTGGYLTLAATLCKAHIGEVISNGEAKCFMHGPTFMANPMACAVANASIDLMLEQDWQQTIANIEAQLKDCILPLAKSEMVTSARVLGSIGVVETKFPVNVGNIQKSFIEDGVWIRPFGKLIYIMPPLVIEEPEIKKLGNAIARSLENKDNFNIQ